MTDSKQVKKDLALNRKQEIQLLKKLAKSELSKRISYVPDIIMKDKVLCDKLTALPCDEARIVLSEVINSALFHEAFDAAINNSAKLSDLRKSKAKKAEKRKAAKSEDVCQTDVTAHTVPSEQTEVWERYSQAEISEQNEFSEQTFTPEHTDSIGYN